MKQPEYLYRYCSAERALQVLANRALFLCPPVKLNDLFEGSAARLTSYDLHAARELTAKIVSIRRQVGLEEAREITESKFPEHAIQDNFTDIAKLVKEIASEMRNNSGLTCFSEVNSDQRMWATYGCDHTGVCIEFTNRTGRSEIHRRAQPILYTDKTLSEHMPSLIKDDLTIDVYRLALWCFFVKSMEWAGEREWRVFTLSTKPIANSDRLLRFEAKDVRRVYCGARTQDAHRAKLQSLGRKKGANWAILDVVPEVHDGISQYSGFDVLEGQEDFRYWFPEAFANKK